MTAAARAQRLSEGAPGLVQASLGLVQEDRAPQEAYDTRVALMSCVEVGALPGSLLQGGNTPAAVGQLHTKVHDYKQFRIKYGVRRSGVSDSILTSFLDLPSHDLGSTTVRTLFWLRVKELWGANSFCPQIVTPVGHKWLFCL